MSTTTSSLYAISSWRKAGCARQQGAAVIEFAIVLTMLLLIAAGIVEFGRAFWYYDALAKATRDGARIMSRASKAEMSGTTTMVKTLVKNSVNTANLNPALTEANVLVTCMDASFNVASCTSGANPPANVSVAITGYTINIGRIFPLVPTTGRQNTVYLGIPLSPQTTMPVVQ